MGDEQKRKLWLDQQKDLLLDDEVLKVISNIKNIRSKSQQARKAKQIAINYYEQHEDRMLYKTYKDKGLLIG